MRARGPSRTSRGRPRWRKAARRRRERIATAQVLPAHAAASQETEVLAHQTRKGARIAQHSALCVQGKAWGAAGIGVQ
eukprot:9212963-Pyramimonas_sp.AAC.1